MSGHRSSRNIEGTGPVVVRGIASEGRGASVQAHEAAPLATPESGHRSSLAGPSSVTNLYGHQRELPTLRDGTRVEITEGDLAGEPGVVDGWYYGFGGGLIYTVVIDGWAYPVPALPQQLTVEQPVTA